MTRYVRTVIRHNVLVLCAVVTCTVFLATRIGALHVVFALDDLLPSHHPFVRADKELEHLFGGEHLVMIGLEFAAGDAFTAENVDTIDRLTAAVSSLPGASNVLSLTAVRARAVLGRADGIDVVPIIETRDAAGLTEARRRFARTPIFRDVLVSRDGRAASVLFEIAFTPDVPDERALRARIDRILATLGDRGVAFHLGGEPIRAAALAAHAEVVLAFFAFAVVLIGLIHYEAFRTVQGFALPLVTAILAVVWGLGVMGLTGVVMDPINVATPILILAIAAGHAAQILKRYYEEYEQLGDNAEAIVRATSRVGTVMITAGLVAALAFFSLVTFETVAVRNFGILTGLGILAAVAIEMTLIPALRSLLPPPPAGGPTHGVLDRVLQPYFRWVSRSAAGAHAAWTVGGAAALGLAAALAATTLSVDNASRTYFHAEDPVRQDDRALNRLFAGTFGLDILLDTGRPHGILEPDVLAGIDRLQRTLADAPTVGKAISIVDLVRSLDAALENRPLDDATLPGSARKTAQLLFLYSMSDRAGVDALLDPEQQRARILVFTHDDSTTVTRALIERATRLARETFPVGVTVGFGGELAIDYAWNEVMVHGKIANIAQIAALIIVAGALVFRSVVAGFIVAVPLVLSVLAVFAAMATTGVKLDIGTVTIAAMAVGLGADFSIYLLYRVREEIGRVGTWSDALHRALDSSGRAIAYVASAVVGGYLTLCLTGSVIHQRAGVLVSLAMLVAATATTLLLPALLTITRPRFLGVSR